MKNDLLVKYPLEKEWNIEKNKSIPDNIALYSNSKFN